MPPSVPRAGFQAEKRPQIRRLEGQHLAIGREQPLDFGHRRAGTGAQDQFLRLIER